jgi:hypothetical protein
MKKGSAIAFYLMIVVGLVSCDEIIFPELQDPSQPALVVDAYLTNEPGQQNIRLTSTIPYFSESLPVPVRGASIVVTDDQNRVFTFNEREDGQYIWIPPTPNDSFGEIGRSYFLEIIVNGVTYTAESEMRRTIPTDSIVIFEEIGEDFLPDTAYLAQFYAVDPKGPGDTYWIRPYKNGEFLNRPNDIVTAFDAAFSEGALADSGLFIQPIRQGINPFDEVPGEDNEFQSSYQIGDTIRVDIWSITSEVFDFLSQVRLQTDRPGGFSEIFAQPLANVPSNIETADPGENPVVGMFSVSAVTTRTEIMTEEFVRQDPDFQ